MCGMTNPLLKQPGTDTSPDFHVGDRFRKARESAGYTAQDFAYLLEVSRDLIRGIEKSAETPKRHMVIAWAVLTDSRVQWLVQGTGKRPSEVGRARIERAALGLLVRHLTLVPAAA